MGRTMGRYTMAIAGDAGKLAAIAAHVAAMIVQGKPPHDDDMTLIAKLSASVLGVDPHEDYAPDIAELDEEERQRNMTSAERADERRATTNDIRRGDMQ